MKRIAIWCRALCATLVMLANGCTGSNEPVLAKVSGVVLKEGQPVEHVVVEFQPVRGRPSIGRTDENGNFELTYTAEKRGAQVGDHRVIVRIEEPDDHSGSPEDPPKPRPAPENPDEILTMGTVSVTPGFNSFDFELTEAKKAIVPESRRPSPGEKPIPAPMQN